MLIMQSVGGVYPLPRHVLAEQHVDRAAGLNNHTSSVTAEGISRLKAQFMALRAANEKGVPQTVFRSRHNVSWTHMNAADLAFDQAELYFTILPSRFFQ